MFDNNKLGEIRPNQLITTFGPGSIVDAVKDSVTVLDLNYWKEKGKKIIDGRLASYLGVDCFYMPRTSYSGDIPVVSFPYMHVCSNVKCGRIFDLRENFDLDRYLKFGVTCPECHRQAYPSRFITICENGHMDDFPWSWWVHGGNTTCKGTMRMYSTGNTSTLADMWVECSCGARRSMSGATQHENFEGITTKDEIEQLIAGNAVEKRIRPDLTYNEIDNSIDNIWSVLFTTGYLTRLGKAENGVYKLIIPNQEVREVFVLQIREWFNQTVANNRASTDKINQGFLEGEVETIQQELTMFLGETISVFDTKARNEEKEIFYHGILLGILKNYSGWVVKSNRESGDGFADILLKPKNPDAGIIVELKYARSLHDLDQACERALEQIEDRRYDTELREDGRNDILAYGIAFCRKRCKVVVKKL